MGSKVSIQKPRLSSKEYLELLERVRLDLNFIDIYLNNGNDFVCKYLDIGLNTLYKLVKDLQINLTPEQKKYRNKIATEQKVLEKYGVNNNFERLEVQAKVHNTVLEKYGVDNVFQADTVKEKIKQTCIAKYGVEYTAQSSEVKEKIKQTNIERYGVDNYAKTAECRQKMINTCLQKYGKPNIYTFNSPEFRQLMLNKYGVKFYSQTEQFKQKITSACMERYNVPYYCLMDSCQYSSGKVSKLNKTFKLVFESFGLPVESEYTGISPYSYDFKINNYLIEINPSITHNSSWNCFKNGKPKDKYYHQNKTKAAYEHGFRCICI